MGYCLYITRANSWLETKATPISEDEWMAVVETDPTLVVNANDFYDRRLPDGTTKRSHPVEWSESHDGSCFWFEEGAIHCKNPSDALQRKMVQLAKRLGAKVLGEEGEEYT